MSEETYYCEAILFPYNEASPRCVRLKSTVTQDANPGFGSVRSETRRPHPEELIGFYWQAQYVSTLPGTHVSLGNPYVIFYQSQQQDLPTNTCLTQLANGVKGLHFRYRWAGSVLVAKYSDVPFGDMAPCVMNDIPIILRHISQSSPLQPDMVRLADNIHTQEWLSDKCTPSLKI